MAEIEITLPTVQYGNVKVRATPEELGLKSVSDAYDVGVAAAVYLNVFTQGFKKGATLDVAAPSGAAPAPSTERLYEDAEDAINALDEGLGGVTEIDGPVTSDDAPWNKTPGEAPAKPWETEVTAPVVIDATW